MSGLRVVLAEIRNVGHLLYLESYLSSGPQLSTEDKFLRFLYQLFGLDPVTDLKVPTPNF